MRVRLFGPAATGPTPLAPGFRDFLSETEFGIVLVPPGCRSPIAWSVRWRHWRALQRPLALRRYVWRGAQTSG